MVAVLAGCGRCRWGGDAYMPVVVHFCMVSTYTYLVNVPYSCSEAEFINTISLRFLGIILRVLRLEVSIWIS